MDTSENSFGGGEPLFSRNVRVFQWMDYDAPEPLEARPCKDGVWRVLLPQDDAEHPRLDGVDP